jgi:RNA polymerase sigma-70 factor (ECF subfamily)
MLGSRAEAEDLVQETYLRWHRTERARVRNPQAWLVTAVTRLAIDRLRSLKTEREAYDGPWLPEPLIRLEPPPPDRTVEVEDDLSVAFLVLLERLGPEERALFLLRDVFDLDYRDVAEALGKSEAACRQAVHRARRRLAAERRRFEVSENERIRLLERFDAAVAAQDEAALLALFAPDSEWTSDGGGKVHAARKVLRGPEWITRLVLGVTRKVYPSDVTRRLATINGEAGLLFELGGRIVAAMSIATDGERILAVYQVLNPDKLPTSGLGQNPAAATVDKGPVTGAGALPSTR